MTRPIKYRKPTNADIAAELSENEHRADVTARITAHDGATFYASGIIDPATKMIAFRNKKTNAYFRGYGRDGGLSTDKMPSMFPTNSADILSAMTQHGLFISEWTIETFDVSWTGTVTIKAILESEPNAQ